MLSYIVQSYNVTHVATVATEENNTQLKVWDCRPSPIIGFQDDLYEIFMANIVPQTVQST
jgi:hypothetical protein